jgi:hypothetical protein
MTALPARAERDTVGCALEQAGLGGGSSLAERWSRGALAPKLAVGVRGTDVAVPGLAARSIEVFAWVRFPLARRGLTGTATLGALSERRQRLAEEAASRKKALAQIRARPHGGELRTQLDDLVDEEEARAELAALGCP